MIPIDKPHFTLFDELGRNGVFTVMVATLSSSFAGVVIH